MALTVDTARPTISLGNKLMKQFRVTTDAATATNEGFVTGLANIFAVSAVAVGATGLAVSVVLNADDTAGTEDETPGSLGFEASAAGTFEVTVFGV